MAIVTQICSKSSSYKTTWSGIAAGLSFFGTGLMALTGLPAVYQVIGLGFTSISTALVGVFARDNDKTSQQVNAGS